MTNKNIVVSQSIDIDTNTYAFLPTGSIIVIGGNDYRPFASVGWIDLGFYPCNGTSPVIDGGLSTTVCENLFNSIQTKYGGSSLSNFLVPNLNHTNNPYFILGANSINNIGIRTNGVNHTHNANVNGLSSERAAGNHTHNVTINLSASNVFNAHGHSNLFLSNSHFGAAATAINKAGGNAEGATPGHGHNASVLAGFNTNAASGSHSHSRTDSITHAHPAHSHTMSASFLLQGAVPMLPYVSALYFIKL